MKKILPAFLMLSFGLLAKPSTTFEPCEKTYVAPEGVDLHPTAILVDQEGENLQTSALYSDSNGLYYRDCLKAKKTAQKADLSALFRETDLIVVTDDLLDPITELENNLDPLVFSDQLLNEEVEFAKETSPQPQAPTSPQQPTQPSSRRNNNWPFCDKQS